VILKEAWGGFVMPELGCDGKRVADLRSG
jgi:hypothetical protein